jgi:large subunit ribosomal protein L18
MVSISDKKKNAQEAGKLIAQTAIKAKITQVVFDKGPYKYHGVVKLFAEGAREGGLIF